MSVQLARGQRVSLEAGAGRAPAVVRMGLGWQAAPRRGLFGNRARQVDLDASALLFAGREVSDVVFYRHLVSDDGSVRHGGDDQIGGSGLRDDESITVDLRRVPAGITQVVFTVSSFTGQSFAEVQRAHCRLVDEPSGLELARFELAGGGPHTGQIMAKVYRESGEGWGLVAIGAPTEAREVRDLLPAIEPYL